MTIGFRRLTGLIRDGESVSAGVTNRPLRTLDEKINYLWDVFEASAVGQALFRRQVSVAPEVQLGMPVWWNSDTERYEPAITAVDTSSDNGSITMNPSSRVAGIVREKFSTTLADITVMGNDTIDLTNSAGESPEIGPYYLSGTTAGKLTSSRPAVPILALIYNGDNRVTVLPQPADSVEHVHYRFDLTCLPAGETVPPALDSPHVIDTPDSDAPGWLPADHPSFDNAAPTGARFGYNLAAHPALRNVWPPLPVSQAYLEWDQSGVSGFTGVASGYYIIDRNGLWWMTNCYGEVPWPTDVDTTIPVSTSASASTSATCPPTSVMGVRLWFTRPQVGTLGAMVTSLRPGDDRVIVRCAGNGPNATAGDLEIALNLALTVISDTQTGYLAFKELNSDGKILRGPVAAGVFANGSNITLSGDATSTVDGKTAYHGNVGLTVSVEPTRQLSVELFRLHGAETDFVDDTPFLGFAASRDSSTRSRVHIPDDTPYATPRVRIRLRILGSTAGDLPVLTVTARRILTPDGPTALPTSDDEFAVVIDTEETLSDAYEYFETISDAFDVAAGDDVLFTVSREGTTDGYPGTVGILSVAVDLMD